MIDKLPSRAVIIPGFSETVEFARPLAKELTEGPYALVDTINEDDIIPIADYLADPESFQDQLEGVLAVTHSAGCMGGLAAAQLLALNPVEPIPLRSIPWRALKVGNQPNNNPEEGIAIPPKLQAPKEVMRHPIINTKIAFAPRKFSSVDKLAENPHLFPDGRMLFAFDQDEFRFQREEKLALARSLGMHAAMLKGLHNEPMYRPRHTLKQITDSLNSQ